MSWVAVAIGVGSAVAGAGASIYASGKQSDAAQNALAFQQQVYQQNQQNIKPYLGAGQDALTRLGASYLDPSSVTSNPDYQFNRAQGMDALQNSAAAKGGLLSGNFLRRADQFGSDYATNYLQSYRGGLQNIANMGANAASGANSNASTMSGQIGGQINYLGGAQASGAVGAANAFTGGAQNYLLYNALGKSSYGNRTFSGDMSQGYSELPDSLAQSSMGGGFGGGWFG